MLPFSFARRAGVIAVRDADGEVTLKCQGTVSVDVLTEARRFLGRSFRIQTLSDTEFGDCLAREYSRTGEEAIEVVHQLGESLDLASLADSIAESDDLMDQENDAPIIKLINALLTEAVNQNASDIHIETFEKRLSVRFRVDGVLRDVVNPKRELAAMLVSRIKVMSRLDIAEKRLPQDGRISIKIAGRELDVRVSTLPSSVGERIVLRLLDKKVGAIGFDDLGMASKDRNDLDDLLLKPHGVVLVTGPTGSGKTTTLYAGLNNINDGTKSILTIEDPIEYQVEGIGQTQVNTKTGMTFARGLRAILRQDPDVVMVGEIRDRETAEIAIQASLTGHLVLSTLHTNSAVGAITRLLDMGVEPFLLSSSITGILAQRLVRELCPECKTYRPVDDAERKLLGLVESDSIELAHPQGCSHCNGQGYSGRKGIFELIVMDASLKQLVHSRASEAEFLEVARSRSQSIQVDGFNKVLQGITTIEEVLRVSHN